MATRRPILTALLLTLVSAVGIARAANCADYAKAELEVKYPNAFGTGAKVQGPMNVAVIERKQLAKIAACSDCPQKPFGYAHAEWEHFKSQFRAGDCIVFFRSDRASWQGLAGVEGYALMRGEKLILEMLTAQS